MSQERIVVEVEGPPPGGPAPGPRVRGAPGWSLMVPGFVVMALGVLVIALPDLLRYFVGGALIMAGIGIVIAARRLARMRQRMNDQIGAAFSAFSEFRR